jgi:hypothetical protein
MHPLGLPRHTLVSPFGIGRSICSASDPFLRISLWSSRSGLAT